MFRDQQSSVEDERSERFTRDRMQPGEPAYQRQRPTTQTPLSTARPLTSPTTPAAHPQSFPHTSPHHHAAPTSPGTTEHLPPLSTALYTASKSSYYDPTSDHGVGQPSGTAARYESQYPSQQTRDLHAYPDARPPQSPYNNPYRSPVASSFPHHSPLQRPASHGHIAANMEAVSHSPASPRNYHAMNHGAVQPPPQHYERRPSVKEDVPPPAPKRDPMSLSSIMDSGADPEPPAKPPQLPAYTETRAFSKPSPNPLFVKQEAVPSPAPADLPYQEHRAVPYESMPPIGSAPPPSRLAPRELPAPDEAAVEAALAHIETNEMKDVDTNSVEFQQDKEDYESRTRKRALEVEATEGRKRKRRRDATVQRYHDVFSAHRDLAKQNYSAEHESEAWQQVQNQEIAEEKERKKDMQRKRRREKTIQNEEAKRNEALARANEAENDEEREKHLREASKAERKAKNTSQLLQGNAPSKDFRELTPHAPNFEGGTMSSFQASDELLGGKRKGGRAGGRLKKSKEQKQAEKDAAAAGQAALDRGDDLPPIAPREEARLEALKSRSGTEDLGPITLTSYNSQAYQNLYNQIWKDIAKKDVPKVFRIKDNSLATKQSNLRKTAQLASKEARRWQMRTNKSMKDVQARAKRSMREMLGFWKRNERDERDQRKMAERAELENARKAEAEKESNRQKRKLNFLIQQTELYSHFIGKKAKTEEIERSTDDADAAADGAAPAAGPSINVSHDGEPGAKVTKFDELDFDNEDETALQAAAIANAQHAVKEAQDRARAFNNANGDANMDEDEGELNFQNPSGLQDEKDFIPQPKLLNCTLKEYQLKGLNWLVNLYEQGINGILADEMGLGKTVQSISVMAYLAEKHNYWGPFLVIAPASTLHNWQQEIAKFVPAFKVIPYWGTAGDRKILRKYWDRKHRVYNRDSQMHVLVTSYQLVVQDAQYFQKMHWQYMILDEAQAIKSSQSSRWKSLLGFNTRNRLLLTGTPIQNNMQELWALLHFIMPSLFDSHDEFSDWFSKDIESHAQSNTKLNEDQLKRLHMILKPFMLRRVKKHVQKELGDKIELDVFCDLTYRQRAYYTSLRNKISLMDLIEKAVGDEQDTATLMNLVMQFRKVCNHPDLFERTDTWSPLSFAHYAETASFMREGQNVNVAYSTRNLIEYRLPRLVCRNGGRLDIAGPENPKAGFKGHYLDNLMNIWNQENIHQSSKTNGAFAWLRLANMSAGEASKIVKKNIFQRAVDLSDQPRQLSRFNILYDEDAGTYAPKHSMLNIIERQDRPALAEVTTNGYMQNLLNVSQASFEETGLNIIERCAKPAASAPPIELYCSSQGVIAEKQNTFFNTYMRNVLYGFSQSPEREQTLLDAKAATSNLAVTGKLPAPTNTRARYAHIDVPSMQRFVTDSGKLAKLDSLLRELKANGHRVLLYFQMTRMMDMVEEYLTYRKYKYCRLDGSTKLEDRRDTVAKFQAPDSDIFVFLLSTRAGGLGINLVAADTVIFYDSDWNPTIDSQAMDRAHRLGQTRQVTVYRLITRGTIEERIRKRALQKEEVQRVVISGGAGAQVDFNTRSRENRTKDIAMWLADDEQAAEIEKKEAEMAEAEKNAPTGKKRKRTKKVAEASLDDMYHEGEGHFDTSEKPSGAATPISNGEATPGGKRRKGMTKKAKTAKQRLAVADGQV